MTIGEFLAELPAALDQVQATLPTSAGLYPLGPRIRFLVYPPPKWSALPPLVDPVGAVWYARTGHVPSLLAGPQTCIALGLAPEDGFTLLHACDEAVEAGAGPVGSCREGLVAVIEGWRSHYLRGT